MKPPPKTELGNWWGGGLKQRGGDLSVGVQGQSEKHDKLKERGGVSRGNGDFESVRRTKRRNWKSFYSESKHVNQQAKTDPLRYSRTVHSHRRSFFSPS